MVDRTLYVLSVTTTWKSDLLKGDRKLTRSTSFSCRSNTCVVKLRCVRKDCRASMLAIPCSRSAIYPTWFPCASIITYLFACSNPLFQDNPVSLRPIIHRPSERNAEEQGMDAHSHHHIHHLQLSLYDQPRICQHARRRMTLFKHSIWVLRYMNGG